MPEEPFSLFPHESAQALFSAVVADLPGAVGSPALYPVVVPSVAFRDWLQLHIARQRGVCMGFEFLTPQDFLGRVPGPVIPGRHSPWTPQNLQWKLLPEMPEVAVRFGMRDAGPRDLLALAGALADRFDQYGHFRPDMIRSWASGSSGMPAKASPDDLAQEEWQRKLWGTLGDTVPHPAVELARWKADPETKRTLVQEFPELMVVGSGSMDPLLLEVLAMMCDAGCRVTAHMLLPSMAFLGDLKVRGKQGRSSLQEQLDPGEFSMEAGHPLLESMGRQSVGTFLLLGTLDEQYTHWPEVNDTCDQAPQLLTQLQLDIRGVRRPTPLRGESSSHGDASLSVHSCFGPRRELEVLREEILKAFRELPNLRPEDIHVVTPSLEIYAPLVEAVFGQGGQPLPVRITEVRGSVKESAAEAILAMLRIAHRGRFTASELLDLAGLPASRDALGISADEKAWQRIRHWVAEAGFTHGLGHEMSSPRIGTWRFARDRMTAGKWLGPGTDFLYPKDGFILPVVDDLGADEDLWGRWIRWVSSVEEIFVNWIEPTTPDEWSQRLAQACGALFSGEDDAGFALRQPVDFLATTGCRVLLDAGAIMDWLDGEVDTLGHRPVLSGKITFGGIKPLQNLPCRILAMVGMEDGTFPNQARIPAWDLLQRDPRIWDRNPRVDDRQLFLDAVLTPTDRLILCASSRNVRTGRDEPLSACVDELLRTVAAMGVRREELVVAHPLQPFSKDYFVCDSGPEPDSPSHDPSQALVTQALLDVGARKPGQPFFVVSEQADKSGEAEIALGDLIDFWSDPAKAFLKSAGIFLLRDADEDEALDRSPLELKGLDAWQVKDAILDALPKSKGPELEGLQAQMRANRLLPPGWIGSAHWKEILNASMLLVENLQRLQGKDIFVEVMVPGSSARVSGHLRLTCEEDHLLDYRIGEFKMARHFLSPWIHCILAAASGRSLGVLLLDEANPGVSRVCPEVAKPEVLLQCLVRGFLEGKGRPLCYAPATGDVYARAALEKTADYGLDAARTEWWREGFETSGGDGLSAAARLAWRDRDPFEDPEDWIQWGDSIAIPLHQWKKQISPIDGESSATPTPTERKPSSGRSKKSSPS